MKTAMSLSSVVSLKPPRIMYHVNSRHKRLHEEKHYQRFRY